MKYTIEFNKKTSEKLFDKVYKTLDLVFGYALTQFALYDGKAGEIILESDDDAECELDRILPDVGDIFEVTLSYDSVGEDEKDEE